jgi:hypothetical protein
VQHGSLRFPFSHRRSDPWATVEALKIAQDERSFVVVNLAPPRSPLTEEMVADLASARTPIAASGETLPQLKLHYRTLGSAERNAAGSPTPTPGAGSRATSLDLGASAPRISSASALISAAAGVLRRFRCRQAPAPPLAPMQHGCRSVNLQSAMMKCRTSALGAETRRCALIKEVGFARDLYGAFSVKRLFWVCDQFFVRSGKAVLRPVACDQVRGARGRGQGTETLAELGGLPPSVACVSQRLEA